MQISLASNRGNPTPGVGNRLSAKKNNEERIRPAKGYFRAGPDSCTGQSGEPEAEALLFLPGLSGVSRDPAFFIGTGQLAVECVGEFHSDNVIGEGLAV